MDQDKQKQIIIDFRRLSIGIGMGKNKPATMRARRLLFSRVDYDFLPRFVEVTHKFSGVSKEVLLQDYQGEWRAANPARQTTDYDNLPETVPDLQAVIPSRLSTPDQITAEEIPAIHSQTFLERVIG